MPSSIVRPIYIFKILLRIQKIYKSFPKWRDPFANFFHENELSYFEHLAEFEKNKINFEEKFVYFPLPMQPEMTTSAIGGEFRDQLLALERLSNILPEGIWSNFLPATYDMNISRIKIWEVALDTIIKYPIFGVIAKSVHDVSLN